MKNGVVFLLLLFVGCHRSVEPLVPEPPIGKAYIRVEYDGKTYNYVEGKKGIIASTNFSSFLNNTTIVGMGGALRDSINNIDWGIVFYFKTEEYQKNTGNFTKLFDAGKFDYLLLDKSYKPIGERGVVITTSSPLDTSTTYRRANTTLLQKDDRVRVLEVKKAYFYNLTYDRFIWVEGNFESWMSGNKKIKGVFRIKVQHDLK
ncbi:hypothetical protein [Larkinella sp. C7]|uniref:hypothetical protein n=1 Tax=Larkinella sp. C7 TaxID=2576607 RepID=UPI0011112CC6|nr:hypothetical protein [Larkinella sp. C7]